MSKHRKLYRYRVDKEEAEKQRLLLDIVLPGVGDVPIGVTEVDEAYVKLTGRQALALLRVLERNRMTLERQAEAERDQEYGCGPGVHAAEVPQKIKKGDPRIGKRAITYGPQKLDGTVTAILHYSNGAQQIEITQVISALDSPLPGTATACVHADDVEIL